MTYNTGNAVPSRDPRDLLDNAESFDIRATSREVRSTPDRLGVPRKTWYGMEQDFAEFLAASGFEPVHLIYQAGVALQVDRPTQLIDYSGSIYRVKMPANFPVTLTGTWATDSARLVDVGDQSLRQDLADSTDPAKGAGMVGSRLDVAGSLARTVATRLDAIVTLKDFGAIGDGASHPLSTIYASLAEAQAVYPFATSLTNEIDRCALQAAVNAAALRPMSIDMLDGTFVVDDQIAVPSGAVGRLFSSGAAVIKAAFSDPTKAVFKNASLKFSTERFTIDCGATATAGQATCPIGFEHSGRIDPTGRCDHIRVINCRNFAFIFNQFYDAKCRNLQAFDSGWTFQHKDIFKKYNFAGTAGSWNVYCNAEIFGPEDVGKMFAPISTQHVGQGGGFIAQIAEVVTSKQIRLTTPLPYDFDSNRAMFGPVTCNGSDGGATLTLSSPGAFDLTGRRIVIPTTARAHMYTVQSHVGTTLTLTEPLIGDAVDSDIITGSACHMIDGNGAHIDMTCEGALGPVLTGRLDWIKATCKAQSQHPMAMFYIWGNYSEIETNASWAVMPFYVLAGQHLTSLKIDNAFRLRLESERKHLLHLMANTPYSKIYLTLPRGIPAGWRIFADGNGSTRNLILNYEGTSSGYNDNTHYYSRAVDTQVATAVWTSEFTEVLPLIDLDPALIFAGSVIDNASPEVYVHRIRVSMQDIKFNASDESNHYALVVTRNLRGTVDVSSFPLYPGSPAITESAEAPFTIADAVIAAPLVSRNKGGKLRVSIRKVGTPPVLNGIGRGLLTVAYTLR